MHFQRSMTGTLQPPADLHSKSTTGKRPPGESEDGGVLSDRPRHSEAKLVSRGVN